MPALFALLTTAGFAQDVVGWGVGSSTAGAGGLATLSFQVPTTPALVTFLGARFYQQALVPDPLGGGAAGFVMSNATTCVIGF